MTKEWFIAAHEELIAEYMDEHPEATESEAYEATGDAAYDRMIDMMADAGDAEHDRMKEGDA